MAAGEAERRHGYGADPLFSDGRHDGSGGAGNVWKEARSWPIASKPRTFYLMAAGGLRDAAPRDEDAKASYSYDPCPAGADDRRSESGADELLGFKVPVIASGFWNGSVVK